MKFFFWNQSINSFTPKRRISLLCQIMKRTKIVIQIHVYTSGQTKFNSKNSEKRSLSYETKASMSFIVIRKWVYGSSTWKERTLLCESVPTPIGRKTLILKMVGSEVFFLKPKHQFIILKRRMSLWCQIIKRTEIIMWIRVITIDRRTLIM